MSSGKKKVICVKVGENEIGVTSFFGLVGSSLFLVSGRSKTRKSLTLKFASKKLEFYFKFASTAVGRRSNLVLSLPLTLFSLTLSLFPSLMGWALIHLLNFTSVQGVCMDHWSTPLLSLSPSPALSFNILVLASFPFHSTSCFSPPFLVLPKEWVWVLVQKKASMETELARRTSSNWRNLI